MLERALVFLKSVAADGGRRLLSEIAEEQGIPLSTAQRWVTVFERQGVLVHAGRGRRIIGMQLKALTQAVQEDEIIRAAARPLLRRFAKDNRATVHLGMWDGEMVTYLIKESAGPAIFTREGMKLEGYCSAIGKILLAHLPSIERDAYVAEGPFVALTSKTIVDPVQLHIELARAATDGYALDEDEVQMGLRCCAVPIHDGEGRVRAALSRSMFQQGAQPAIESVVDRLNSLARDVELRLFKSDLR